MSNADWLDAGVASDANWPFLLFTTPNGVAEGYMSEDGPIVLWAEYETPNGDKPDSG